MADEKTNWELVDTIVSGENKIKEKQLSPKSLADSISASQEALKPDGIISKYKQQAISRKTSIELMKVWYSSQLEVTKHQLGLAVEVKKKETDAEVERLLADINKKHLHYLMELDFVNTSEKQEATLKLGNQTAEMLEKLQSRDWPAALKEQMINGVIELNKRFFEKIMKE
jgi:hypothetical protein